MAKNPIPGVSEPIKVQRGPVKIEAWRDTDIKGAKPSYFLEIKMSGWEPHELMGISPLRIRALGQALLDIADAIPGGDGPN